MKIQKFHLSHLRNEEHFQFMTDFKHLFEPTPPPFNFDLPLPWFTELLNQENQALEIMRKNQFTDTIAESDAKRDSLYRSLVLQVESHSLSQETGKQKAAHSIQLVIDHYGDFRYKSYNEETATITNFVQELGSRCSQDINTLGLGKWINDLGAANLEFDILMNKRHDDNARQGIINLRETRKAIDKVFISIIDMVNATVGIEGESSNYTDFMNKVNERIDYYKQTLAMRKARAEAKKETVGNNGL